MAKSIEHNLFPDLAPRAELYEKAGLLEKAWLDQTTLGFPAPVLSLIKKWCFFHVKGVQAICEEKNETLQPIGLTAHFFSGLYNQQLPLIYLIYCKNSRINIYLGTVLPGKEALTALLETTIGRSLYTESTMQSLQVSAVFTNCSAITGIPTSLDTAKKNNAFLKWRSSADCLISGMAGQEWVYMVQAFPVQRNQTHRWVESCSREIKDIKEAFLLRDIQKSNRMATYYTDMLEKSIKRLTIGKQQGLWQTGTFVFSGDANMVSRGAALLSSTFSGSRSIPEPVRSHVCSRSSSVSPLINCYHSKELGCFISLPGREFPGFCLREQPDFDVDFSSDEKESLLIGRIMAENRTYDFPCSIPVDDLTKHGLIAGVTGSGKTNSVFHILMQVYQMHSIPFMVIEPAKSEYRNLLNEIDSLLVFTIGEERPDLSSPFRLNPFYFPSGISLQTHIDFLKAVFNASFGMYAPMPYILEECLYEIYQDKGWNLVTSGNTRGNHINAFPTLSDLYTKIDAVVDNIGYHDRIEMDIKAALKTRINNLCIGGKGMMLNTSASIPFDQIMSRPVVFELKYLGNDEEKAFVMGLILMTVWEHYESLQGSHSIGSNQLKHLLVIEEAHRLLKNVPTEKATEEQSNIKGKGVETFCNLLAEMRACGEGVLVSEQIPVKLAPDVVKNSNLKIMHRLVAKEDRDFMGDTMCLSASQKRQAVRLETGEAVFFREGFDRSIRVKVPVVEFKRQNKLITSKAVCERMQLGFFNQQVQLLMRFSSCSRCRDFKTERCEKNRNYVETFLVDNNGPLLSVTLFIPYLTNPDRTGSTDCFETVLNETRAPHYCMASHLISQYVHAKADYHGWSYPFAGELTSEALSAIENSRFLKIIGSRCREAARSGSYRFKACETFCRCDHLYCYEGFIFAKDPEMHNNLVDLLNSDQNETEFYNELTALILDSIRTHLPSGDLSPLASLSICYLIQKLNEHQFPLKKQRLFLTEFVNLLDHTKRPPSL